MPIIAEFKGIKIYMNYGMDEHNPPHIHGVYNSKRCSVGLHGEVLDDGRMPKKILNEIIKFAKENTDVLNKMWLTQKFIKL